MFCLVDNDPYGLSIYGIYKYGGGQRASTIERQRLALPQLNFLGLAYTDFRSGDREGVIPLTERDKVKIDRMLETKWVLDEPEIAYPSLLWGVDCQGRIEMDEDGRWQTGD